MYLASPILPLRWVISLRVVIDGIRYTATVTTYLKTDILHKILRFEFYVSVMVKSGAYNTITTYFRAKYFTYEDDKNDTVTATYYAFDKKTLLGTSTKESDAK